MKTNDDAAVSREVFVIKQCILARKTEVAKMDRKYWVCVIKRLVVPAIILFAVVMIALGIACYVISSDTVINNRIEIWIDACQYVDFFLPLALCMVFVPFIFVQNSNGFIQYASIRTNRRRYIASQMICIMIVVLIGTVIAYGLPLVFSLTVLKPQTVGSRNDLLGYVWGTYQVYHPYLFGFAWCMWKGVVAMLFTTFGCLLALYMDHLFVAVLLPFLYCMGENLVTALLQIPQYSIMTSYVLNRLSPSCMRVWNYFVGVGTFTIVASVWIMVVKRRKQDGGSKG